MHLLCSERALEVTGNQGVEPAMEWLVVLTYFQLLVILIVRVGSGHDRILLLFKGY
jgi:hypothetical protein